MHFTSQVKAVSPSASLPCDQAQKASQHPQRSNPTPPPTLLAREGIPNQPTKEGPPVSSESPSALQLPGLLLPVSSCLFRFHHPGSK